MLNVRFVPNAQTCPRERGTFVAKEKNEQEVRLRPKAQTCPQNGGTFARKYKQYEKGKRHTEEVRKGQNFLSFEPVGERFNFTYAKAITGFVEGWSQDLVPKSSRPCSTFVEEIGKRNSNI
jgi:hypothetical protein